MKFEMKPLLLSFLVIGLTACEGKQSKSKPQGDPVKAPESSVSANPEVVTKAPEIEPEKAKEFSYEITRKTEIKSNLSNIDLYKENINSYKLIVSSVYGNAYGTKVNCVHKLFDKSNSYAKADFERLTAVAKLEITIEKNDTVEVEYSCDVLEGKDKLYTFSFVLHKSIVISIDSNSAPSLLDKHEFAAVVLDKGAVINTNGKDLKFTTQEFVSLDGKIITFKESEVDLTQKNAVGRSGGTIDITSTHNYGHLFVELRGQNGGVQTAIPNQNPYIPPADLSFNKWCRSQNEDNFVYEKKCEGLQGYTGIQGDPGFQGYSGGASGSLKFTSIDTVLQFTVTYFPGQGSQGGEGGQGGLGGPGGTGASQELTRSRNEPPHCAQCTNLVSSINSIYKYPDGSTGLQGRQGFRGPPGPVGDCEESFIDFKSSLIKRFNETTEFEGL